MIKVNIHLYRFNILGKAKAESTDNQRSNGPEDGREKSVEWMLCCLSRRQMGLT